MKCPTCLSTMKCISEIHQVPKQSGRQRMDLHCYNRASPQNPNVCRIMCHMGALTEDPKEWVCHEYNFGLRHQGLVYNLCGYDRLVDPYHQRRDPMSRKTTLFNYLGNLVEMDFIPISTGDNMHEEVWKLFHRLKNLVIFS